MTAQEFRDALERLGLVGSRRVGSRRIAELLGCDARKVRCYKAGTLEVPGGLANFLTSLIARNDPGEIADLVGSGRRHRIEDRC